MLRVCTRGGVDPERLVRDTLGVVHRCLEVRVTVEDAFVSMVRADEQAS